MTHYDDRAEEEGRIRELPGILESLERVFRDVAVQGSVTMAGIDSLHKGVEGLDAIFGDSRWLVVADRDGEVRREVQAAAWRLRWLVKVYEERKERFDGISFGEVVEREMEYELWLDDYLSAELERAAEKLRYAAEGYALVGRCVANEIADAEQEGDVDDAKAYALDGAYNSMVSLRDRIDASQNRMTELKGDRLTYARVNFLGYVGTLRKVIADIERAFPACTADEVMQMRARVALTGRKRADIFSRGLLEAIYGRVLKRGYLFEPIDKELFIANINYPEDPFFLQVAPGEKQRVYYFLTALMRTLQGDMKPWLLAILDKLKLSYRSYQSKYSPEKDSLSYKDRYFFDWFRPVLKDFGFE